MGPCWGSMKGLDLNFTKTSKPQLLYPCLNAIPNAAMENIMRTEKIKRSLAQTPEKVVRIGTFCKNKKRQR